MLSKFLIAVALIATATNLYLNSSSEVSDVEERFTQFITAERRSYFSKDEYKFRLGVFSDNIRKINQMNANPNDEAEYGVNLFSDRTQEEFEQLLGLKNMPIEENSNVEIFSEINENRLRDKDHKNQCNKIKNQGSCGSCWAFAANAVQESTMNIRGQGLPNLSEQDLVDCSRGYGNQGCNGGWYYHAWDYVKAKGGLSSESAYPYTGKDGTCKSVSRPHKITGYSKVTAADANIETAINDVPVAVAVDASNWSSYKSGIFSNCATSINHAVTAVGYVSGSHWLIRNSWGTTWGESGYMRLRMGANTCGVRGYVYKLNV